MLSVVAEVETGQQRQPQGKIETVRQPVACFFSLPAMRQIGSKHEELE